MPGVDAAPLDLKRISTQLLSVLGQHCLANNAYDRRLQPTNGEECNGLELWRRLFVEHKGDAQHAMMAGRVVSQPHRVKELSILSVPGTP